jgi:hypothetical protein
VSNGGSLNGSIPKETLSFDCLSGKETENSEHGNTSMRHFGLAVSLEGVAIRLFSEPKRIKDILERWQSTT